MDRIKARAILKSSVVLEGDVELIYLGEAGESLLIISVDNPTGKIHIQGNGYLLDEIETNKDADDHNVRITLESKDA
jgi:hypothetical protein